MKVKNINYSLKNKKVRLSAQIVLKSGKTHSVYYEVDKEFKDFIAKDASPFLPVSLGLSMKKKEVVEIEGTISKRLLKNSPKIMKILQSWDPGFSQIVINSKLTSKDRKTAKNVGCFFSGGVDSFYTYLKNRQKIKYLIFVHGFDINVKDEELFKKIEKNIAKIADQENVRLIKVKTNVREMFDQYFDWPVSHEFAIASVALFLRSGFKEIYLSCGLPNKNTDHYYLTPDLDPLWSTENMRIVHYGCAADKIIKLEFLSHFTLAMENLRVCWVNKNKTYNCCECEKCFRNMLSLYVSGSLEKCRTFNKILDLDKLKKTRASELCLKYFIAIIEALKFNNDRSEVRFALEEMIENNIHPKFQQKLYHDIRDYLRGLDNKYNRNRIYWFLAQKGLV